MPVNARKAAMETLLAVKARGARPEAVLAHHGPEDPRERALAAKIVNGVLQNELYLDYVLSSRAANFKKLPPAVREILRLSAYQILFLDRVPDRAAVNEGVELAKKTAPHAAGVVNAVLRRLCKSGRDAPIEGKSPDEALSTRYSHPLWLVRVLMDEYGPEVCEKILAADNETPPITAQVNTLRTTAHKLAAELEKAGVETAPCPLFEDALTLSSTGDISELEAFQKGLFYIQDPAARMAVTAAGIRPGDTVLDMCAAPGGKSFAAAMAMENLGRILAFDIHGKKAALVASGAERLGISILTAAPGDAREARPELFGIADAVLCDVPCSGFGVIRKKPEIRSKDPAELERLPAIQLDIFRNCADYVKPGGRLVYSTCTILKRENDDVADAFLRERTDFEPEPFTLPEPFGPCGGRRTILPFEGQTDGFFICVLRKK